MKTLLASWSRCGRTVCKLHSRVSWSSWSESWSSLLLQSVISSSLSGVVVKIIVLLNMVIVMIARSGQSKLHYVLFLAKVKVKFLVATDICKQPLPAKEESFQSSQGPVISWHSTWVGATMKYNEWFPWTNYHFLKNKDVQQAPSQ